MALGETLRHPGKELAHTAHVVGLGIQRHWKSLALVLATTGTAVEGYFFAINPDRGGTQNLPLPTAAGMDKPPETGSGYMPMIPTTEPAPIATPAPTKIPTPTPEQTTDENPCYTLTGPKGGSTCPPETTATVAPTATPAPEPTPTLRSEPVKEVPCLILPDQYCSQGEVIRTKNSQDGPEIYIGFNLPAGIPIFAGMDGQALKIQLAQPSEFQGYRVTVLDPNLGNSTKGFVVIGDLRFKDMLSQSVKVGQEIAQTQNTGIKNLDYNILITVRQATAKGPVPAEDILKQLFPAAFIKPSTTVSYQGPNAPIPNVSTVFLNQSPQ